MKHTVWKFPLRPGVRPMMPRWSRPLHVSQQDGQPFLWALVDPESPLEERDVAVFGTGHDLPDGYWNRPYLGTITGVEDGLVLHVWDEDPPF